MQNGITMGRTWIMVGPGSLWAGQDHRGTRITMGKTGPRQVLDHHKQDKITSDPFGSHVGFGLREITLVRAQAGTCG